MRVCAPHAVPIGLERKRGRQRRHQKEKQARINQSHLPHSFSLSLGQIPVSSGAPASTRTGSCGHVLPVSSPDRKAVTLLCLFQTSHWRRPRGPDTPFSFESAFQGCCARETPQHLLWWFGRSPPSVHRAPVASFQSQFPMQRLLQSASLSAGPPPVSSKA